MLEKPQQTPTRSEPKFAITGHRFSLLFFLLLGVLILYPYADSSAFGYYMFRTLTSAVLLLGVYAISFRRSLVLCGLALAIPALLEHLHIFHANAGALSIIGVCFSFIFDAFVLVVISHRVFYRNNADSQTIFGALCIYLLVGYCFSGIYQLVEILQPNAFFLDPQTNLDTIPDRMDFIYYSFGTMTSVGANGISAVTAQARSLTVIEAILGVLYLAVLIARLMGSYRSRLSSASD